MKGSYLLAVSLFSGSVFAAPAFFMPKEIPAVPNLVCRVFFARMLDTVNAKAYVFEARCEVGQCFEDRWEWCPKAKDAGSDHALVLNAWNDDGIVASVTTTVHVAQVPKPSKKDISLALLGASSTNCGYPDILMKRMHEAGFAGYRPVGSHSGSSAAEGLGSKEHAAHDGYGGYSWGCFMTRYAMTVDEIDNVQAEAEREQLQQFGIKLAKGQEWRRALLKSPLVRVRNGKKVVDVQAWFDKINGGKAPDYILINLGGNVIWCLRPEDTRALENEMANARKLIGLLRAAAPNAVIGIGTSSGGSLEQEGWARNYGCKQPAFLGARAFIRYNRAVEKLVAESNDARLRFVPFSHAIDPVNGYPRGTQANALHANALGGTQEGEALYAWLVNDLERGQRARD